MFLELFKPQVIDLYATRDRIKLRVGENRTDVRLWLNLTFETKEEWEAFRKTVNEVQVKEWNPRDH